MKKIDDLKYEADEFLDQDANTENIKEFLKSLIIWLEESNCEIKSPEELVNYPSHYLMGVRGLE